MLQVAALIAAVVLFVVLLERLWSRASRRRHARRRTQRYMAGERDAELLLEELGYDIVERQLRLLWPISCDGTEHTVELRADLIVERDDARYVAEVKTGEHAPSVTNAATRRQLLEYRVAYDVDGVLLVDVERGEVLEVEFPLADVA